MLKAPENDLRTISILSGHSIIFPCGIECISYTLIGFKYLSELAKDGRMVD